MDKLIIINSHKFRLSEFVTDIPSELDKYETIVFKFIYKWLSNRKTFKFKSSGSTGLPKSIKVHRDNLEASARRTISFLEIDKGIIFNNLSVEHVGGAMQVIRALVHDLDLHIISPSATIDTSIINDWSKICLISLVPYQLQQVLSEDPNHPLLTKTQNLLIGGGPMNLELTKKVKELNLINIYETYGMTETLSHIALRNTCTQRSYHILDGVNIRRDNRNCLIIDDNHLNIKSVVTNDIVDFTSFTSFIWKGRFDLVINSGGLKFHIEPLEEDIYSIMNNHNVKYYLFPIPDHKLGQTMHIAIESDHIIPELEKKSIYESLVTKYQVPKKIHYFSNFVYSNINKIMKRDTLNQKPVARNTIE